MYVIQDSINIIQIVIKYIAPVDLGVHLKSKN